MNVSNRRFSSWFILLVSLFLAVATARSQNVPLTTELYYPTNNQVFGAPANIYVHARVADSNFVKTVQYFSGSTLIGTATNTSTVLLTNLSQGNTLFITWSNVSAGNYSLTSVATDSAGNTATSAPVNISVTNPVVHPVVYIYSPTNGSMYLNPAGLTIYARAAESSGTVATVQFFANNASLGIVSNSSQMVFTNVSSEPLFPLGWSNVMTGNYALKAVATDLLGNTATSSVVNISVVTNFPPPPPVPFAISFWYPTNGQTFGAPARIGVHARVTDSNVVEAVQYFANGSLFGTVTNVSSILLTNASQDSPFYLLWSNVLAGTYSLTAVALDNTGASATSAPVNITVTNVPPSVVPFTVGFFYPTNGQTFLAPATVGVHARVTDSNMVETVQYFANGNLFGTVSNTSSVLLTNTTQGNPFYFAWSNVLAGTYALTAVALDGAGNSATSAPVNIIVTNPPPPPNVPFLVSFFYPTNGQTFLAPATVGVHARVTDSNAIEAVEYFANGNLFGTMTNSTGILLTNTTQGNPFYFAWSSVLAGTYALTAVAVDSAGNSATSAPVNIVVTNPPPPPSVPFVVSFWYPTNGQTFVAPANVGVHARVTDSNLVDTVQYFANGSPIGTVTNTGGILLTSPTQSNPFFLAWSNVPAGTYALTAVANDSAGNSATSAPVTIFVLVTPPPVITIYAPDPVAIEGTNYPGTYTPTSATSNYVSGANTATFVVHRDSQTNVDLTVYYSIGGTAINGIDYEPLPGEVTIPAGKSYALITIYPLEDTDSSYRYYDNVVLGLLAPPTAFDSPATYSVGSPSQAGAVILEEDYLPIPQPQITGMADSSLHVSLPSTNGVNYALQVSSDLVNWTSVCTNTVLKGSAQYLDPNGPASPGLYYRVVPVTTPASY